MQILVIGTQGDEAVLEELADIAHKQALPLELSYHLLEKLSDKFIIAFASQHPETFIIAIIKGVPTLIYAHEQTLIKSTLNWQALTKRIVSAGRKSEILLQACKLTAQMSVIDGTAGFGHDGLILASTGVYLTMIEQNPLMALLLHHEHTRMSQQVNWQKLLGRIQICHGDFLDAGFMASMPKADVVYLDPMFPSDSYSAKVGKNMQVLHEMTRPPSDDDELLFLSMAKDKLNDGGKIIVKRPISAPYLAGQHPTQSVANDAIRFDRYSLIDSEH